MTVSLTTPVTGGAQTGFTAPTYTIAVDTPPDVNAKQWYVSALGGTQAGVTAHSISSPFTVTATRPKNYRSLGKPHPVTGLVSNVPMNTQKFLVRKGCVPLAGQPSKTAIGRCEVDIPAGADTADPANVRALYSLMIGALTQASAGLGDTAVSGTL